MLVLLIAKISFVTQEEGTTNFLATQCRTAEANTEDCHAEISPLSSLLSIHLSHCTQNITIMPSLTRLPPEIRTMVYRYMIQNEAPNGERVVLSLNLTIPTAPE